METYHKRYSSKTFKLIIFVLSMISTGVNCQKRINETTSEITNCYDCHDPYAISTITTATIGTQGLKEWMSQNGGLYRNIPSVPSAFDTLTLNFSKRGTHLYDLNVDECAQCHPIYFNVENHGNSEYPPQAKRLLYMGGVNCAENCHTWLKNAVYSTGFSSNTGVTPIYNGTLDPYLLLTSVQTAHTKIFLYGFRITQTDPTLNIRSLNPGCGGCHNYDSTTHGHIAVCTDCHVFDPSISNGLHQIHVSIITATQPQIDPSDSGMPSCAYCHGFSDTTTNHTLSNAVCYNCHLSGHQPMGADGMPQFWDIKQ